MTSDPGKCLIEHNSGIVVQTPQHQAFSCSAVWPVNNREMSLKVAQNNFTREIKDTFTKIA